MQFASIRIITSDVNRLASFYEKATGIAVSWLTDDFAQIVTPSATLAIGSIRTVQALGERAPQPGTNRSVIIEFRVDDVDAAWESIRDEVSDVVLPPTTMPWGNRSVLFLDPDGNLINFFAPAKAEPARS